MTARVASSRSGIRPIFLGFGINLNLHAEFSFGLEFSLTGEASVLNTLENDMNNLNTAFNLCYDTVSNICGVIVEKSKNAYDWCSGRAREMSIWCGVVLLRSQAGKTPTRIEKRLEVRGWLYQEKLGRFESFPPHQFKRLTIRSSGRINRFAIDAAA